MLTYTPKPELGKHCPDFSLWATDGNSFSLASFSQAKILVIIFTCNHCPFAKRARPKIIDLYNQFKGKSIQFVAINPNDDKNYPEDSLEKMKEEKYNYPFPYLRDASQQIAREFGAVCTPDIFVFNEARSLVYRGHLKNLQPNLEKMLKNEAIDEKQKPSMGCSIKWEKA